LLQQQGVGPAGVEVGHEGQFVEHAAQRFRAVAKGVALSSWRGWVVN
jgi:hypothetical protein